MFKTLDNESEDIFYPLSEDIFYTTIDYETDEFGIRTFKNVKAGQTIKYTFTTPSEGYDFPLYFSEKNYTQGVTYYLDGKYMPINTYWNKGIFSIKDTIGHKHNLTINFTSDFDSITLRPELYYENLTNLKKCLQKEKESEFIIDKIENTMTSKAFKGHINLNGKVNKDLLFTLPNEKGIKIYIDGKKVAVYTKFNIFTAVDISKLEAGNHKITIQYTDTGLVASLPLFIITALGLVPLVIFYNKIEEFVFKKRSKKK